MCDSQHFTHLESKFSALHQNDICTIPFPRSNQKAQQNIRIYRNSWKKHLSKQLKGIQDKTIYSVNAKEFEQNMLLE